VTVDVVVLVDVLVHVLVAVIDYPSIAISTLCGGYSRHVFL